jgi:hypothetical protein
MNAPDPIPRTLLNHLDPQGRLYMILSIEAFWRGLPGGDIAPRDPRLLGPAQDRHAEPPPRDACRTQPIGA